MNDIKNIYEEGQYEDFRMTIEAQFFTTRVKLKVDLTTGDVITPREIDYNFKNEKIGSPLFRSPRSTSEKTTRASYGKLS